LSLNMALFWAFQMPQQDMGGKPPNLERLGFSYQDLRASWIISPFQSVLKLREIFMLAQTSIEYEKDKKRWLLDSSWSL